MINMEKYKWRDKKIKRITNRLDHRAIIRMAQKLITKTKTRVELATIIANRFKAKPTTISVILSTYGFRFGHSHENGFKNTPLKMLELLNKQPMFLPELEGNGITYTCIRGAYLNLKARGFPIRRFKLAGKSHSASNTEGYRSVIYWMSGQEEDAFTKLVDRYPTRVSSSMNSILRVFGLNGGRERIKKIQTEREISMLREKINKLESELNGAI